MERELDIPVFHDDQHGTAIVVTAALINALRVVGKKMEDVHIVLNGPGAAGTAIIKMLKMCIRDGYHFCLPVGAKMGKSGGNGQAVLLQ